MNTEWSVLFPAIVTAVTGLVLLVADVFVPRPRDSRPLLGVLAAIGLVAAGLLLLADMERAAAGTRVVLGGAAVRDGWGSFIQLLVWIALALTVLAAGPTLRREGIPPGEFHCLLFLGAAGMMMLAVSHDLMMVFLNIEILSVALYALAALPRGSARAVEGGVKYFVLGGLASAFLLYGIAMVYGASGRIDLAGIGAAAGSTGLARVGLGLMLVGMAFKVGAVPFHAWVPDAYEGAPAAVTGFMASAVKVAVFGALLRLLFTAFPSGRADWGAMLEILAIATLLWANFAALAQTNLKRLLAYSSIAHTGYVLIGVVAASGGSPDGASAAAFYLLVYAAMTLGVFGLLSALGRGEDDLETMAACAGLARRHPAYAAALTVLLVSLAGIPPTAGFFAKFYVFRVALEQGHLGLTLIGVLGALVSAYYYLRPVVAMYMQEPSRPDGGDPGVGKGRDWAPAAGGAVAVALVIAIGLFPSALLDLASRAVSGLMAK